MHTIIQLEIGGSDIEECVEAVTSVRDVEAVRDVETVECPVCGVND